MNLTNIQKVKESAITHRHMPSPWSAFPDDQMLKPFKGFLEKWPCCPLCGGRYGFIDNSSHPILLNKEFRIACLKNTRHFSATVKHTYRKGKDQIYVKKAANFGLYVPGCSVSWNSFKPEKILLSFLSNKFDVKFLKVNFGSIDRWFIPEPQLKEHVDKYRILI